MTTQPNTQAHVYYRAPVAAGDEGGWYFWQTEASPEQRQAYPTRRAITGTFRGPFKSRREAVRASGGGSEHEGQ